MKKLIYIFTTFYFLSFSLIFGNPMVGNRLDECGPGKVISPIDNAFIIFTLNSWWFTGNTTYSAATSSGTSECKGFSINDKQRVHYIATNFYEIQEDLVKGGGVYLDALTTIMGCEGTNFQKILKNDYESIFNEDNSDGKKIYNALRYKIKNSELRTHCIDYS